MPGLIQKGGSIELLEPPGYGPESHSAVTVAPGDEFVQSSSLFFSLYDLPHMM